MRVEHGLRGVSLRALAMLVNEEVGILGYVCSWHRARRLHHGGSAGNAKSCVDRNIGMKCLLGVWGLGRTHLLA